ncbi:hypothetical protein EBX31_13010, partial [bacterium]|nr:hypothetical protein [bacterium]
FFLIESLFTISFTVMTLPSLQLAPVIKQVPSSTLAFTLKLQAVKAPYIGENSNTNDSAGINIENLVKENHVLAEKIEESLLEDRSWKIGDGLLVKVNVKATEGLIRAMGATD